MRKRIFTFMHDGVLLQKMNEISRHLLIEAIHAKKFCSLPVGVLNDLSKPLYSHRFGHPVYMVTYNPRRGTLALFKGCPDWLFELKVAAFRGSVFDGGEK